MIAFDKLLEYRFAVLFIASAVVIVFINQKEMLSHLSVD